MTRELSEHAGRQSCYTSESAVPQLTGPAFTGRSPEPESRGHSDNIMMRPSNQRSFIFDIPPHALSNYNTKHPYLSLKLFSIELMYCHRSIHRPSEPFNNDDQVHTKDMIMKAQALTTYGHGLRLARICIPRAMLRGSPVPEHSQPTVLHSRSLAGKLFHSPHNRRVRQPPLLTSHLCSPKHLPSGLTSPLC